MPIHIYTGPKDRQKYERLSRLAPLHWGKSLSKLTREFWDSLIEKEGKRLDKIEKGADQ